MGKFLVYAFGISVTLLNVGGFCFFVWVMFPELREWLKGSKK